MKGKQAKMIKNKVEFKSRIDTIQTKELISNRVEFDIDIKGVEETLNKKGELITKWNVNNALYEYSNVYELSHTKKKLEELMQLVTVINVEDVKMNRIDICTDSTIDFVDNAKLIQLLHKCLVAKIKGGKVWLNIDDNDNKVSNVRFANRDWNIEFYDKKKESESKSLYNTRFEVRHLRVKSQEFEYHVDKTIQLWQGAINNIEVVNKIEVEKLKRIADDERKECPNMRFTTYVDRHNNEIFTLEQLKELYKWWGLKGSFKSWLNDYRKTHILELVNKTQLNNVIKEVVKSLKSYKKL